MNIRLRGATDVLLILAAAAGLYLIMSNPVPQHSQEPIRAMDLATSDFPALPPLQIDPEDPLTSMQAQLPLLRGASAYHLGDYHTAIQYLQRAASENHGSTEIRRYALWYLANAHLAANQPVNAMFPLEELASGNDSLPFSREAGDRLRQVAQLLGLKQPWQ